MEIFFSGLSNIFLFCLVTLMGKKKISNDRFYLGYGKCWYPELSLAFFLLKMHPLVLNQGYKKIQFLSGASKSAPSPKYNSKKMVR